MFPTELGRSSSRCWYWARVLKVTSPMRIGTLMLAVGPRELGVKAEKNVGPLPLSGLNSGKRNVNDGLTEVCGLAKAAAPPAVTNCVSNWVLMPRLFPQ